MNFFQAQDNARKNTFRLVLLFSLAVIGLILLTNLFLLIVYTFATTNQLVFSPQALYHYYSWKEFTLVSLGVCLFVLGGSLYKIQALSGGGPAIAQMLGGQLIPRSTRDRQQRQLLNVVEEMANMISASRSYQGNVEVANTSKELLLATLKLGQ